MLTTRNIAGAASFSDGRPLQRTWKDAQNSFRRRDRFNGHRRRHG
jgi:hypothetical protein